MNSLLKISLICTLLFSLVITVCQAQFEDGIVAEYTEEQSDKFSFFNKILKEGGQVLILPIHGYESKLLLIE